MTFNLFVLPFFLGLIFLLMTLTLRYSRWIAALHPDQKATLRKGISLSAIKDALGEVFMESLLHRRMFRRNALMGYMHMSFAFGWFLLIVIGNIESRVYSGGHINPPYYPIFLKFFIHDKRVLPFEINTIPGVFRFSMDLVLLMILSGLALAMLKRLRSKWFGIRRTTSLKQIDKVALTALWLIFPLRLLAESLTAGMYQGGGFLTNTLGEALDSFLPSVYLAYPAWWAYSLALGVFFVGVPWTRFMHIPTEVFLIFLRHFGLRTTTKFSSYSEIEINACPRCGICIDVCPMHKAAGEEHTMAVYFLRALREGKPDAEVADTCLLCGRCLEVCPVQINTNAIRIARRAENSTGRQQHFDYLKPVSVHKSEVIYFAGCMSHLTPAIKKAMLAIFSHAKVDALMLDENGTICCGRPLKLAGQAEAALALVKANEKLIAASGALLLVTSCPICYKSFKEDYHTGIEVLHHSQYLNRLAKEGKLKLNPKEQHVVFHDPCELGRGSGIYDDPRELLARIASVQNIGEERENALCCGGSIGDLGLSRGQRKAITNDTLDAMMVSEPGMLVTACPLCKKTFASENRMMVMDIAEVVAGAIE